MGAVLRAVEVPERGGDTLWADMACAYDNLPPDLRDRIDGMRAVHSFVQTFGHGMSAEQRAQMLEQFPPVEHPVVRTHPETGRDGLFVNQQFTQMIIGLSKNESNALLEMLYRHCQQPEVTCRSHWRPGSVAFWDNRATLHYALDDYGHAPRYAHRVTLQGDKPFGPAMPLPTR